MKYKKTLKTMFLSAFLTASLLNTTIPAQAAYQIAGAQGTDNMGTHTSHKSAYIDIHNLENPVIADKTKIKQVSNIKIFLQGKEVTLPNGVLNYDGNTYLPMRDFAELLNAKVEWINREDGVKAAEIKINDRTLGIPNQNRFAVVNVSYKDRQGRTQYVDTAEIHEIKDPNGKVIPSINHNSRTYLPMRFICEFFDYTVVYTANNQLTNTNTIEIYQGERPQLQIGTKHQNTNKWRPVGVSVGTEEQWEKFYTQKHPITGATPIPGIYGLGGTKLKGIKSFYPVYDHNGDGRIGNSQVYKTVDGVYKAVDETISLEEFKSLPTDKRTFPYKNECTEYFRNNLANPKPSQPGKEDGEKSEDRQYAWASDIKQWVPSAGINTGGTNEVWQANDYQITEDGRDYYRNDHKVN